MTTIHYFRRQNYGNIHFYFAKRAHRAAFRNLTGKKTFDADDLLHGKINALNVFGNFSFTEVLESNPEVEPILVRLEQ